MVFGFLAVTSPHLTFPANRGGGGSGRSFAWVRSTEEEEEERKEGGRKEGGGEVNPTLESFLVNASALFCGVGYLLPAFLIIIIHTHTQYTLTHSLSKPEKKRKKNNTPSVRLTRQVNRLLPPPTHTHTHTDFDLTFLHTPLPTSNHFPPPLSPLYFTTHTHRHTRTRTHARTHVIAIFLNYSICVGHFFVCVCGALVV